MRLFASLGLPWSLLFIVGFLLQSAVVSANTPKLQPSPTVHKDFLLAPWKSNAKPLVVFKDPFCPYCLKTLEKKHRLVNYNVFLFWYPIFGERSEERVNEFFRCDRPSGEKVIDAVLAKVSPRCGAQPRQDLIALNQQMITSYMPQGVPAFYLGGQKTSLTSLDLLYQGSIELLQKLGPRVRLDWARYQLMGVSPLKSGAHSVALLLPDNYPVSDYQLGLLGEQSQHNWYVFISENNASMKNYCKQFKQERLCLALDNKASDYRHARQEFALLTGQESVRDPVFIYEGKKLSPAQFEQYIPKQIIDAFL